jgi:hypothetical protein
MGRNYAPVTYTDAPADLGTVRPVPWALAIVPATVATYAFPRALTGGPVLCPFRHLTGHSCPTCGLTRSAVAFAHGGLGASFHAHPFGPLLFVVALAWALNTWARQRNRRSVAVPVRWRNAAVAVTAISWLAWWPVRAW